MRLTSFLRFFANTWQRIKPLRNKKRADTRTSRLLVEMLERRELLAVAPTVLSVLPNDGSINITGVPTIRVEFSETMSTSALNASNYVLLGATEGPITIDSIAFDNSGPGPVNSSVLFTYNGGAPGDINSQLVVDSYTLFMKGDRVFDMDDNLAVALPGQLIVGNSGRNNVAVVGLPGDGTIGAISNYTLPGAAGPREVGFADLDRDGIKDLVVINAGTNQAAIYLGQKATDGGGYDSLPNLTLNLTATPAGQPRSLVLADFNKDNRIDIAVTNSFNTTAIDSVSVFLNSSTGIGSLSFGAGTSTNVDTTAGPATPVGLVAADFDGDTNIDLAVMLNRAFNDIDTPADAVNDFRVAILAGNGAGAFTVPTNLRKVKVGDTASFAVGTNFSLAAGNVTGDAKTDLIVGVNGATGSGVYIFTNTSPSAGTFTFSPVGAIATPAVRAIAVGNLNGDAFTDIVVTTTVNTVQTLRNNAGGGTFTINSYAVAGGTGGNLAVGDLDNNGRDDIVVSDASATGELTVLRNASGVTTKQGSITAINGNGTSPVSVTTSAAHGLATGDQVLLTDISVAGFNGLFTITVTGVNTFLLNGTDTLVGTDTTGRWSHRGFISVVGAGGTISFTTTTPHGLATGDRVMVSGVAGYAAANSSFSVTVVNSFSFTVSGAAGTATANIASASRTANVLTITTAAAHNLTTLDTVRLAGILGLAGANGVYGVTVTGANTFTVTSTGPDGTATPNTGTSNGAVAASFSTGVSGSIATVVRTAAPTDNTTVTTTGNHGLAIGDQVTISGVTGLSGVNGIQTITAVTPTTFTITTSGGAGASTPATGTYDLGVSLTSRVYEVGNTPLGIAIATTPLGITRTIAQVTSPGDGTTLTAVKLSGAGSSFSVGDIIQISGVTGFADGTYTIATIPSGTATYDFDIAGPASMAPINATGGIAAKIPSDVNQDGFADVVVVNNLGNDFTLLPAGSDGSLLVGTNHLNAATITAGVTVADMNGDGIQDIISFSNNGTDAGTRVSVRQGLPGGAYAAEVQFSVNFPGNSDRNLTSIAIADITGDNRLDIIVTSALDNRVAFLRNNIGVTRTIASVTSPGNGVTLTSVTLSGTGVGFSAGDVIQISGVSGFADGSYTIAAITGANTFDLSGPASATPINGTGGTAAKANGGPITSTYFTPLNHELVNQNPLQVTVGDFNEDGAIDLAIAHNGSGGVGGADRKGVDILLGNKSGVLVPIADGTFADPINFLASTPIESLVVGDFNKDGNLDIVAGENGVPGNIYLLTGNGLGGFTLTGTFATSVPNVGSVIAADLNNDGYLDIIVGSKSTNLTNAGIAVLFSQLGTGFAPAIQTDVIPGTGLNSLLATDLNQDGLIDIVAAVVLPKTTGTITAVNDNGAGLFRVTSANHGLSTGQQITITGSNVPSMNATWTVTVPLVSGSPDLNNFVLNFSTFAPGFAGTATWNRVGVITSKNNVFSLISNGDGTFRGAVPYEAGANPLQTAPPSFLAQTTSPFIRLATFRAGTIVNPNLINNGNFEARDLNGEVGNLVGWSEFSLQGPGIDGSHGEWLAQTGTASPKSVVAVPAPTGTYRAMLDQDDLFPITLLGDFNTPDSYAGTHTLYQDVTLPANATSISLALDLYINSFGTFTDPAFSSGLDYNIANGANQQVRVDIMRVGASQLSINTTPQATGGIVSAVGNGGGAPIIITTTANHGLATGAFVNIAGVSAFSAANGLFNITVIDASRFSLDGTSATGTGAGGTWSVPGDVLLNVFQTNATTVPVSNTSILRDLSVFAGQTIRLRIATVNNQGKLIVGIDNVAIKAKFADVAVPTLSGLAISNPSYVDAGGFAHTSDPTIIGKVTDNGGAIASVVRVAGAGQNTTVTTSAAHGLVTGASTVIASVAGLSGVNGTFVITVTSATTFTISTIGAAGSSTAGTGTINNGGGINNLAYIEIDPQNTGFVSPTTVKITQWDAAGNFSYTLPTTTPGLTTIQVRLFDKAGNFTSYTFQFHMLANSVTEFQPIGPQGIDVTGQFVDYTTVSGRITTTVVDSSDPTGNTYFVGSVNGGVWRTTDGGNTWLASMNNIVDSAGNRLSVAIGSMAQSTRSGLVTNQDVFYAGTGVADRETDSRAGVGILKSIDHGRTWFLVGDSGTVLAGARISQMIVDPDNPNIAYAAVASGGTSGPGVYKTTDGGLTWVNVLTTAVMTSGGVAVAPGTVLASVTDMVIDPQDNNRLLIGLGNIGLDGLAASSTAGVWETNNKGATWSQELGGDFSANSTLPTGVNVGRVTLAIADTRTDNERVYYVMIASPPAPTSPFLPDTGMFTEPPIPAHLTRPPVTIEGLYKTLDNGLNFTKVMLRQHVGAGSWAPAIGFRHRYVDINIFGRDAANTGAMVVDPNNSNVVYIGGSDRWQVLGDPPNHSFIRVDTGNIILAQQSVNYEGDDFTKFVVANSGEDPLFYYLRNNGTTGDAYDPYFGEGVYWHDLDSDQSGAFGFLDQLPDVITTLNFDAQGRLVVGTSGGVFRGSQRGFGYDTIGDGFGIMSLLLFPPPAFDPAGMDFVSINGNLSISSLTSVAIDPINEGAYYTTQLGTGTAGTTGGPVWVSQGLYGPLGFPNPSAGAIVSADPAFGSVPGTNGTLYRVWQFAYNGFALQTEISTDNGLTWRGLSDGISLNVPSGIFPALAINPRQQFISGVWRSQLAFGTRVVYLSNTDGATWNQVSPTLSGTATITAIAFAPSTINTMYAATSDGRIFYTTLPGQTAGSWIDRTTATLPAPGTPGVFIKGITVDPLDPDIAFIMYGGTGIADHVFRTLDAGVTWTAVTTGLQSVAAYSMVIDRNVSLGAPLGKWYLGTDVGVYLSLNQGDNWTRLGAQTANLPNSPVVELKLDVDRPNPDGSIIQGLDILAAATQGRGAYTISTAAFTNIPDQIILEDTSTVAIPLTINDPTGIAGYTLSVFSDRPALIPEGNVVFGGSGVNRTVTFTPAANRNNINEGGTANITITITATSGPAFSYSQTINISVTPVNDLPTFTPNPIGTREINRDTTNNPIPIVVSDVETPAAAIQVTATSSNQSLIANSGITVTSPGAGAVASAVGAGAGAPIVITTTTAHNLATGTLLNISGVINFAAANGQFTITVIDAFKFSLNGTTTFGTGDANTGSWSGAPGARTIYITPVAGQTGNATITVTINDLTTGIVTHTFDIIVNENVILPFADSFTRPDNNVFLGKGWTIYQGDFDLVNNEAVATGVGASIGTLPGLNLVNLKGLSATNAVLEADIRLGTGNSYEGFVARFNGGATTNFYWGALLNYNGTIKAEIYKHVAGVWTLLSSQTVMSYMPDTYAALRFEVIGDSMKLFLNNAVVGFANDSSITAAGTFGVLATQGERFDNFSAAALTATNVAPGFTEPFNANPPRNQLSDNWRTIAGNFTITGTGAAAAAVGTAGAGSGADPFPTNMAVVNAASQTDGFVQANVTVDINSNYSYAGIVGRYTGNATTLAGAQNMYTAILIHVGGTGGSTLAQLYKNVGGTTTLLSSTVLSPTTATALLRLEIVGTSLELYADGVLVGTGNGNDALLATGAYGIAASLNGRVDNFTFNTSNVTASLPYPTDTFTQADGTQINLPWINREGFFTAFGNAMRGTASVNTASLNGLTATNVSVQANITLASVATDPNAHAGVIARYNNATTSSTGGTYYIGLLIRSPQPNGSNITFAQIYRVTNGVFAPALSSLDVTGVYNPGDLLRLDVVGDSLKLFLNGNLVGFANDASITSGSIGMLSVRAVNTIDNFAAQAVAQGSPSLTPPYSDNFTNPDGTPLSADWIERSGSFTTVNNAIVGLGSVNIATLNGINQANVSVQMAVTLDLDDGVFNNPHAGVIVRHTPGANGGTYYTGLLIRNPEGNFYVQIYHVVNGNFVAPIASAQIFDYTPGALLRLDAAGNSLKVYYNGTLRAFTNNSALTTGSVGMLSVRTTGLDTFGASVITLTNPAISPPFTDNFTGSDGDQLNGNWLDRFGNFSILTNSLTGRGSVNISTLNGLNQANMSVQASITLDLDDGVFNNPHAGVIARHTDGPNGGTYYIGLLIRNPEGNFFTQIYHVVNGNFVAPIASLQINDYTPGALLRLDAVGDSLKLYYNGTFRAAANQASIASGSAGILSVRTTAIDDFTAAAIAQTTPTITPPFTDDFNDPDGPLNSDWRDRRGNLSTVSGAARGNAGTVNISALNGISEVNVSVQAEITLDVAGLPQGGVVARYTDGGTYYLGMVITEAGGTFAKIFRVVNNNFTQLTSVNVTGTYVPGGVLRLDVAGDSLKLFLNGSNMPSAFANDSVIALGGSVGILAIGSTIDDFGASVITLTTPALSPPFSDNFDGLNGNQLSPNWLDRRGNFSTFGNAMQGAAGAINIATLNGVNQANVSVQAEITANGVIPQGGVVARFTNSGNYYLGMLITDGSGTSVRIYRVLNGGFTLLAQTTVTAVPGDLLRLDVAGDSLKLYLNGTLRAVANDSSHTTGSVGIFAVNALIDDFSASLITVTTPTMAPTFSDAFPGADGAPLSSNWSDRQGYFLHAAGAAKAQAAGVNIATLNNINQANVSVLAEVTFDLAELTTPFQAGVVARFTNSSNYYLGLLVRNGTTTTAHIFRVTNGSFTQLSSSTVTYVPGQTIELKVVGDVLRLFYNGTLIGTVLDQTHTTGTVGIWATRNHSLDDFSASVVPPLAVPYTENFPGTALDLDWVVRQGSISVAVANAIGNTPNGFDFATLVGMNVANFDVSANVSLVANQGTALSARFTPVTGVAFGNQYYGFVQNTGSGFVAQIYRVVNGTFTLLATQNAGSFSGQMRFQVTGSNLILSLDGVVVLNIVDTVITGAGSAGMTMFNGGKVSNFSVN